jgi:hypothetical protein
MGTIFSIICYIMMNTLVIFDFTKEADLKNWYVVNDTVMGGASAAKMGVDAAGNGLFEGHVSLDNNGGFSSIRYDAGKTKLTGYSKFVIVLKGDGKAYEFRVKTNINDYYSYVFSFETTGNRQTIEIPFSSMAPSFRGRSLDMVNFPGDYLQEIGFLIGNKKDEDFKLAIDNIFVQ